MLESFAQAFRLPDLRRRLLFTFGILVIFRLAAHVPVPGLDQAALRAFFDQTSATADAARLLNLLSGGALENFSVVAMGVYPYITASIIIQLIVPLVPALEDLSKEGESGRNKINMYTYWLTIPLAILQGVAQVALLNSSLTSATGGQVVEFGAANPLNTATVLLSLTAGTMLSLWLGERITESGIGNGVSIIIFGGIVAGIPSGLLGLVNTPVALLIVLLLTVFTVAAIVVVQEGHRRIPVEYGRRVRGTRTYGGQTTYIPLRINSAGMIPLIFANSLLIFPAMLGGLLQNLEPQWLKDTGFWLTNWFNQQGWQYFLVYFVLVVLFTFFYTDVVFRQQNLHESLQRNGGFVPGLRPGKRTEDYLNGVMHRITLVGALFLGLVAVMPFLATLVTNLPSNQSLIINATGLLIVVGVVLDTIRQLEAQLLMRHYEGFM
ncbi:MAG: preprotein translocase subunit SecY [Chloroflexi bacterium CFX6]|nr:preprotein translocase subunit SecY [Chloroflexi bacterium CFX6]